MEHTLAGLRIQAINKQVSRLSAIVVLLAALVVLMSWKIGLHQVATLISDGASTKPVTSLCFMLTSLALLLTHQHRFISQRTGHILGTFAAISAVLISITVLLEYQIGPIPTVDDWLLRTSVDRYEGGSSQMSQGTALGFLLIAGSLLPAFWGGRRGAFFNQAIALAAMAVAMFAAIGYLYNYHSLYLIGIFATMSLPTAGFFILLSIGSLLTRSKHAFMLQFSSPYQGGRIARTILPLMLLLPILVGWLRSAIVTHNPNQHYTSIVGSVTLYIFSLMILVWYLTKYLNSIDATNQLNLNQIRQQNEELMRSNELFRSEILRHNETAHQRDEFREQFIQVQKMEALGRLTGGIAHDFNNMLAVIQGYVEITLMHDNLEDQTREDLEETQEACNRAAALTRQLLAFSRKQILKPKVLDINAALQNLVKMLVRILGERTALSLNLDPEIGKVYVDVSQLEQVVMNLVVNARDAMTNGGSLYITTGTRELDSEFCRTHPEAKPGTYVMLAVRDTGVGIPPEIVDNVFDPFFTTKEKGRGTGLGLSTVHGIVRQSEGYIWLYSEPNRGTTFKIFFPVVYQEMDQHREQESDTIPTSLHGRILVIEDENSLRGVVDRMLSECGADVVLASDGEQALELLRESHQDIDLVLTDVVLPGVHGRKLADEIQKIDPDLKIIFMSGYNDDEIVKSGVVDADVFLLEKPFTRKQLLQMMASALPVSKENFPS